MGPLHLIKKLPRNFLIMNGDILSEINYKKFFQRHKKSNKNFSVAVKGITQKIDYGILKFKDQNLIEFLEKPKLKFSVSMGIYAANSNILRWIPKNKFFGFDNLMKNLIKNNELINAIKYKNNWLDIGRPSDYTKQINCINLNRMKRIIIHGLNSFIGINCNKLLKKSMK